MGLASLDRGELRPRKQSSKRIDRLFQDWRFPVGYGLTTHQMWQLGLSTSVPFSPQEADRPFPGRGLFVINPEGRAHISTSPTPCSRGPVSGPF